MSSEMQKYAALGEIISAIAVVISLLFLTFEIRENTQVMRTTAAAESRDSLAYTSELILNFDPVMLELFERTLDRSVSLQDLTVIEQVRMRSFQRSFVRRAEAQFFRYQSGLLDEEIWATVRNRVIVNMGFTVWQDIWGLEKESVYTAAFIEEIESHLPQAGSVAEDE